MNEYIGNALKAKYTGDLAEAEANIRIYLRNSVGIGDHSDIVSAIDEEIGKYAGAVERIEALEKIYREFR